MHIQAHTREEHINNPNLIRVPLKKNLGNISRYTQTIININESSVTYFS